MFTRKIKISLLILFAIVALASFLRFYRLAEVPPAISWDEAAVGYNAWTISRWGRDEWGRVLPLALQSFGEYKNPVTVYLTVPFVATFGLNDFGTRSSAAFFGVLNVVLIFFLTKKLFKNEYVALLSSLFLAISPYNLQFSRFNHELNFAIFFLMLGVYFFLVGSTRKVFFILAFFAFAIDIITYSAAKVLVPLIILSLLIIYKKETLGNKKYVFSGLAAFIVFAVLIVLVRPEILGLDRFNQTFLSEERLKQESTLFKQTGNILLARVESFATKYFSHFSWDYLFEKGDPIQRHSVQTVGTFYKTDLLFLLVGFATALFALVRRKKEYWFLLVWSLISPLPAILGTEMPHAGRAMYMTASWHIIAAVGVYTAIRVFKKRFLVIVATLVFLGVTASYFVRYINNYYGEYAARYAIEWQYGMREIVQFIKANKYNEVYMTDAFSQPYVFYLYYLEFPLPKYLKTVKYNETKSRPSNLVASFDRYNFGLWDTVESWPVEGVLYVLNPSQYNGLRHKALFQVKELIKYPKGTDAFYIVSVN